VDLLKNTVVHLNNGLQTLLKQQKFISERLFLLVMNTGQSKQSFLKKQSARLHLERSIHRGGEIKVSVAWEKKRVRDENEKIEAIRKARKRITMLVNKAKKALKDKGIAARKAEKARKLALEELQSRGEFPPTEMLIPIRDPEKNPTEAEKESLLPHPSLIQALDALCPPDDNILVDPQLLDEDIQIETQHVDEPIVTVPDDETEEDSDGHIDLEGLQDSTDEESIASLDSIARNADFIKFM
jgi:hypothetical protein